MGEADSWRAAQSPQRIAVNFDPRRREFADKMSGGQNNHTTGENVNASAALAAAEAASPFFLNWTFWSTVIALAALAVSLAPHIRRWITPPRLELELYDRIALTHNVGNPTLQTHVIIRNVGGRETRISSIAASLCRDGGESYVLPARTYLESQSGPPLLFTPVTIGPREEWAHVVNFIALRPREADQQYRAAEYALKADIIRKIQMRPAGTPGNVEADPALVAPLIQMFEANNRRWLPGRYQLTLTVTTTEHYVSAQQSYNFAVFETDADELRRLTDDYNTGAGVYFENQERHMWIYPAVSRG